MGHTRVPPPGEGRAPSPASPSLAIGTRDLSKSFGATRALRSCTFDLHAGEIHAVVGENGSGKSTLVKILAGVHPPDGGELVCGDDQPVSFRSPRDAIDGGIATVFQDVLVVDPRSVLENIWLGADGTLRRRIPEAEKRERASTVMDALLARPLPLDVPVESLSLSERQTCCIARALVRDPRVLILDEATSALDVETRDRLFSALRARSGAGTAIVFISHRMDEISELADRITVMRSGETVATVSRSEANPSELVRLMTGADQLVEGRTRAAGGRRLGAVVLQTRGLRLRRGSEPIDVDVRPGELVGLAGLEGQGQEAFLRALWGLGATEGEVLCGGVRIDSPARAAAQGVAYVPRERGAESLFASKSVRENFGLPTLRRDVLRGVLRPSRTAARFGEYQERLSITTGDLGGLITTLSGGNQQKVLIARWLATEPAILLLNDPTRGVDIGAKRDLYALFAELADRGVALVMVSTEVDEHVELMDRVLVFREHRLAAELTHAQLSRRALIASYFGEDGD